jgi:hypothetical protein
MRSTLILIATFCAAVLAAPSPAPEPVESCLGVCDINHENCHVVCTGSKRGLETREFCIGRCDSDGKNCTVVCGGHDGKERRVTLDALTY